MKWLLFVFVGLFVLEGKMIPAEPKNMDITIVTEMTEILDNCLVELLAHQHSATGMSYAKVRDHAVFKDADEQIKFLKAFIKLRAELDKQHNTKTNIAVINHSGTCTNASLISALNDNETPTAEDLKFCGTQDLRSMLGCPGEFSFQKNKGDRDNVDNYFILIVANMTEYTDNIWKNNEIKDTQKYNMKMIFKELDNYGKVDYFTVLNALDLASTDGDQLARLGNLACFARDDTSVPCPNYLGSTYDGAEAVNNKLNAAELWDTATETE